MSNTPPSTRPYLIRALHEWCCDHGFTPHILVAVNESVKVPREYVKDGSIVLNVGVEATTGLDLGNEFVSFKARFGGVARDIMVPVSRVVAIYARENGQGMAFAAEDSDQTEEQATPMPDVAPTAGDGDDAPPPQRPGRPTLTRVK